MCRYYGIIVALFNMFCDYLPLLFISGTKHLHSNRNVPHLKNCTYYLVTFFFQILIRGTDKNLILGSQYFSPVVVAPVY